MPRLDIIWSNVRRKINRIIKKVKTEVLIKIHSVKPIMIIDILKNILSRIIMIKLIVYHLKRLMIL